MRIVLKNPVNIKNSPTKLLVPGNPTLARVKNINWHDRSKSTIILN
jgi:hypothetical protein